MPGHFLFAVLKQQSELNGKTRFNDLTPELPKLGNFVLRGGLKHWIAVYRNGQIKDLAIYGNGIKL
jgi:hypothetical protein